MAFDRGNRRSFGGPREMHDAVCADCGQPTKVPFVPREGRPVYCLACLPKHPKKF
ncbi:MAG: CxxC-x17-CxxC domain-containing protein [archaeon]